MRQKLQLSIISAAITGCLFTVSSGFAQTNSNIVATFEASFTGKTIGPNETISLSFVSELGASEGQFAVVLGSEDITANFRWISPTLLEGVFAAMPLPTGANTLRVYRIGANNQWGEVVQAPINVNASAAPTPSAHTTATAAPVKDENSSGSRPGIFKPSLVVGLKSQLAEAHSVAAAPPLRETYLDGTLQGGLQTEHGGSDWSLKSAVNIVGSTYQPEAINYAVQGINAPRIDIANYLVESNFTNSLGQTSLSLGHIQAGNHPLLASSIANRGLGLSHKFNPRFDLAASMQSGSQIVGGSNILGFTDNEHRMASVSAGVEALERPSALRLETTFFSGVAKPQLSTGVFTLQDAEQSRGWGLRAKSQNQDGSLRADLAFARSAYTPKGDSTLNILPGPKTDGSAWSIDLGYDAIRNAPAFKNHPFSLSLMGKHEFASTGYKSLGSAQAANYEADTIGMNVSLGIVTGQLQLMRRADNVDKQTAFLKNRMQQASLSLALPLPQLIDTANPPVWAPMLTYNLARNHSFADTTFIPFPLTLANLPNVKATTHGLGLNWTIDRLNFGYQLGKVLQDNQQIGLELQDVSDTGHNFTAAYQFSDTLNISGAVGKRTSLQKFTGIVRDNSTLQATLNWQFGNRYSLSSNFSASKDRDSILSIDSTVTQAQLQLLKLFNVSAFGGKLPAQWSLSYGHSSNNSLGIVVRYQTLNAALSVSFF